MTTEPQYVLLNLYTFVLFIQLDTIKCILKIVERKIQRLLPTLLLILFTQTSYFIIDGNADIPEDEDTMLRNNALKLTQVNAINQCKKMTNLVDSIAEAAIKSMVAGEELRTKSPLGVQMLMTKYD